MEEEVPFAMTLLFATPRRWRLRAFVLGSCVAFCMGSFANAQSLREWRSMASQLVDEEVEAAGVTNQGVLRSMRETPRHEFMPPNQRRFAYYDMALPIGNEQTISPPFVVAYMTQEIDPQPTDRVLEIGTGSGYQAAILSPLVKDVYTIEIVEALGKRAARALKKLDYKNVHAKVGDGYLGWPEVAPFDKIIVTCSPEKVPQPLVDQLRDGGLMIVPVGERYQQNLYLFRKHGDKLESEALKATLFVPMTGEAESRREVLPDPLHPQIANGSFEEVVESRESSVQSQPQDSDAEPASPTPPSKEPSGWHYQRQLELTNDPATAPHGRHFATFTNQIPGLASQALQGFAIDGRKVLRLQLNFSVRGENIRPGSRPDEWPFVVFTFYDDRRVVIDEVRVGPFDGTFAWREQSESISVPLKARECIVRIGLLGAIGKLSLDNLRLTAISE
jgi:protein-L-isoaspartate(D-aspartate) O-methyltransferase